MNELIQTCFGLKWNQNQSIYRLFRFFFFLHFSCFSYLYSTLLSISSIAISTINKFKQSCGNFSASTVFICSFKRTINHHIVTPSQLNNDRPHVAGVCRQFLDEEGSDVTDRPSCFSDLNPTEHLWDTLHQCITRHKVPPQTGAHWCPGLGRDPSGHHVLTHQ